MKGRREVEGSWKGKQAEAERFLSAHSAVAVTWVGVAVVDIFFRLLLFSQ